MAKIFADDMGAVGGHDVPEVSRETGLAWADRHGLLPQTPDQQIAAARYGTAFRFLVTSALLALILLAMVVLWVFD